MMRVVALLAAAAALATGCHSAASPPGAATPTVAAAQRRHPPHLFTAALADPKTFNPLLVVDANSAAAVADVFDALVRLDPCSLAIEPGLAERWAISPDGTTATFFLRRDVRWHDGQPLTAADVVFTFDAIYDERVPNSYKNILTIDGERIRVEAPDDSTVVMHLPHAFAPFLSAVAVPIVPQHILSRALADGQFAQAWGIATPPAQIIGSGPYKLDAYVPAQYLHLVRNPDYWRRDASGQSLPSLQEETVRIVPDQNTAYLKFLAGETDIHQPRPEEVPDLQAQQSARQITVREVGLDTGTLFVTFNRNPAHYVRNGATDPRLRWFTDSTFLRALAHSIDKVSMVNTVMHGYGEPGVTFLSPENTQFYDPSVPDYPYDLDRARQLLAEGGYRDRDGDGVLEDAEGHPVEFTLSTNAGNQVREKLCAILKQDWESLGIKVNFQALDFGLLVEKLDVTFDWDAMLMGFTGSVEPHNAANLLRSSGNLHLWNPNQSAPATDWEAEIDRQLEAGARTLDLDERRRAYWRVEEILHQQLPLIQTVRQRRFVALTDALQNYRQCAWGVSHPELLRFSD